MVKKLFEEFFAVPENGKVKEKVIQVRLIMTIAVVVFCLLMMSFTAYAYFTCNVSSGSNYIKTARFETKVLVQVEDAEGNVLEDIRPITSNYKVFKLSDLRPGEWYTVTVTPTERSTAKTGFVIVTAIGCEKTYHTQQLGVDANVDGGFTPELRFQVMITEATDVVFEARWGTSSYYPDFQDKDGEEYIRNGEAVKLIINGLEEPVAPTEPSAEPTEETEAPTQPTRAPLGSLPPLETVTSTEGTEAPTQPTTETTAPTVQTQAPTEVTTAPTEVTEAPVEVTEAPVEETEAPAEPTEAPVEETEAPAEPTEAPVEVTEAPAVPTDAPTEATQETGEPPAVI